MDIDPLEYLLKAGLLDDQEIDIAPCAIFLAAIGPANYNGRHLERYFHHLKRLVQDVGERFAELRNAGGEDSAETRLAAFKHILCDKYGYHKHDKPLDSVNDVDLIALIDTRRGSAFILGVLYLHIGKSLGWNVCMLDFPGQCLLRLEEDGKRIIFDPADPATLIEAPQMRLLLKEKAGQNAELSASYYEALSNRAVLVRILNIIKYDQIKNGDYWAALETIESARMLAPDEYRLLLDAGVLYSKTGQPEKGEQALMIYIENVENPYDRRDAEILLEQIRLTLGDP